MKQIDRESIQNLLQSNKLDIRAIVIVSLRACGYTYREIGEALGITKQGVHQIEMKYLEG